MQIIKRRVVEDQFGNHAFWAVYTGDSGETKPTDCASGSIFIETDHSDGAVKYMFDEDAKEWHKQPAEGGGGGGGGGEYTLPVASVSELGGIKLFNPSEELPEGRVPLKLEGARAYVEVKQQIPTVQKIDNIQEGVWTLYTGMPVESEAIYPGNLYYKENTGFLIRSDFRVKPIEVSIVHSDDDAWHVFLNGEATELSGLNYLWSYLNGSVDTELFTPLTTVTYRDYLFPDQTYTSQEFSAEITDTDVEDIRITFNDIKLHITKGETETEILFDVEDIYPGIRRVTSLDDMPANMWVLYTGAVDEVKRYYPGSLYFKTTEGKIVAGSLRPDPAPIGIAKYDGTWHFQFDHVEVPMPLPHGITTIWDYLMGYSDGFAPLGYVQYQNEEDIYTVYESKSFNVVLRNFEIAELYIIFQGFKLKLTNNEDKSDILVDIIPDGGGYELPVATPDMLGGIKIFEEDEELPENGIPLKLQHEKAYVELLPTEANKFTFRYDSSDPNRTAWSTDNECRSTKIFTALYDKDNNLALANIQISPSTITVTFAEPLQEGDEFTLLYSSNAGGTGGEAEVDDTTIEYNGDEKLQVKDGGITMKKLAPQYDPEDQGKVPMVGDSGEFELKPVTKVIQIHYTKTIGSDIEIPDLSAEQITQICRYMVTDRVPVQIRVYDSTMGGWQIWNVTWANTWDNANCILQGPDCLVRYFVFFGSVSYLYQKINWTNA